MTSYSAERRMNIAAFLTADGTYHHLGWRAPDSWVDGGTNFREILGLESI